MLTKLGGEDEENVRFSFKPPSEAARVKDEEQKEIKGYEGIDWESMVSGTKKVLTMDVSHLFHHLGLADRVDKNTSDIPDLTITARAPILFLVRVQVQFT